MAYESFNNSKNKLQKSWERSQENENKINKVPLLSLNFNSINFNKKIITIPININKIQAVFNNEVETILLQNFPEWVINMIEVTCIYTIDDGFANQEIVESGFGVRIVTQEFDYWFNNIDETNYNLKIFHSAQVRQFNKGSPDINIPLSLNLTLKIINQRIYETMNSHKE